MQKMKTYWISTVSAMPMALALAGTGSMLAISATGANPAWSAEKKMTPCNPCAAKKKMSPCNPCAAKKMMNPCNPCAAKKMMNPCTPCAAKKMMNPCNPCAAKKMMNPCNPCAAKKMMNPCKAANPCAAKNPCAAAKTPCNPCAAGKKMKEVGKDEARALYEKLAATLPAQYRGGDHWATARDWTKWTSFATAPYLADSHGNRYAVNLANKIAARVYGLYDELKSMPPGGTILKPTFTVGADGKAIPGPLFIMEKMTRGWNAATADWRYAMILPGGKTFGMTKGVNSAGMAFCQECHAGARDNDMLYFLDKNARKK